MSKKNYLLVGCSWSHRLHQSFEELDFNDLKIFGLEAALNHNHRFSKEKNYAFNGCGINHLKYVLKKENLKKYDGIIVQLPTPVRSCLKEEIFPPPFNTSSYVEKFEKLSNIKGKKDAYEDLYKYYTSVLKDISGFHKYVVFLIFNTGGYPFKHPYMFEEYDKKIERYLKENEIEYLSFSFEDIKNCTEEEIDRCGRTVEELIKIHNPKSYKGAWWLKNCVHPVDSFILDAHPNIKTAKIVAKKIRKEIL